MDMLVWLEQSALARALKTSFVVYPLVNAAHIAAIGTLFAAVLLMDLRILGRFQTIPAEPFVALLRRVALTAFIFAVATGVLMFSIRATEYAATGVFLAKMALILLAGLNFLLFVRIETRDPAAPALQGLAVLSILLWTAVLVCGRFIGFV